MVCSFGRLSFRGSARFVVVVFFSFFLAERQTFMDDVPARDDERYPTAVVTDGDAEGLEVADHQHADLQGRDKLAPEEVHKDDKQTHHGTSDKEALGPATTTTGVTGPTRTCCGLKRRTFLIVAAVAALVVVGAVVGGVVGGLQASKNSSSSNGGGSGSGSGDGSGPQPTWTGTGPKPIATGPIEASQRGLAVSAASYGETAELQLFYQDLGTRDIRLRRIRNDAARAQKTLSLAIAPDWGTALAAAAVNATSLSLDDDADGEGGKDGQGRAPVTAQLFYVSSAGRANASIVQATLACAVGGDDCVTTSNSVISANLTGDTPGTRVNARTRLAALRVGAGLVRVYYQTEDGALSVLNGDRAASTGWTATLVRTGVYMSSAVVAHGPAADDISVYYINGTNQLHYLEYSDILGPNRASPVKTAPGSAWDPSVSMAGVWVPTLTPRRLFYARPANGTMVAYFKPPGSDFRTSSDPNWGTVDGGLAAAAWSRQTRVYYFQGDRLVVSAQNVTGWDKIQTGERVGRHVNLFLLRADGEDLLDLVARVRVRVDDDDTVEEVERQAVRAAVVGAADARVAAVAGHDDDGRQLVLQRAVDVREALNVEHVHLVDEQDAWHDLGLALLLPLAYLGVDLVADLAADLARVTGEEGEEALGPRVDDINLVQGDGVDHLLALLELAVGALEELGVDAHGVVIAGAGVRPTELGDLTRRLVNGDDVAGHDALLGHGVDHLAAHVVDGLHVGRLDGQLALLGAARDAPVDLYLDDFAFHNLALLLDSDADGLAEGLREGLGLGHFEGEDLGGRERGEGDVGAEGLRHAHGDGSLSGAEEMSAQTRSRWGRFDVPRHGSRGFAACSPGGSGNEHGAASNLAILDHLQNDGGSLARLLLADEALRRGARLEAGGIDAEATDVRMRGDEVQTAEVLGLGHGHQRLHQGSTISIDGTRRRHRELRSTHCSHGVKCFRGAISWGGSMRAGGTKVGRWCSLEVALRKMQGSTRLRWLL
ncbi:LOW QUALITY PROTEIN: Central kinetochore subunit CHL4 [Purpureocillium lavendulum]|uniref:Central kinetochore subunit CHL4 n=1 Tax=Purpureocillium lavendulum TaxID=1247861 RepID=A0AB34FT13_9HYPO|nr:LOW QUALITY PROTEIN: Central kinetochore subunit CHL4 [Purpureocillium lavendulum]